MYTILDASAMSEDNAAFYLGAKNLQYLLIVPMLHLVVISYFMNSCLLLIQF